MPTRPIRRAALFTLTLTLAQLTLLLAACQQNTPVPADLPSAQQTNDAFAAYERGDCRTVDRLTDRDVLATWEPSELKHTMVLIRSFCLEIDGDLDAARESYRRLIREAPASFAAEDSRERLRILEITGEDPSYAQWVRDAPLRANRLGAPRTPIERTTAQFPPAAWAAGVNGYTIVEFGVTPSGATQEPIIVESVPPFLFDGTSLRAVRQWQFMRDPEADADQRQAIRIVFEPGEVNSPVSQRPDDSTVQ
ncbi:MAG: hypothetical protein CL908_20675 [Deltaproteobacteria bacterium]|jgi:TonB family protein|nr:hypothetical protein [Deltaproteobacteria bacterium]